MNIFARIMARDFTAYTELIEETALDLKDEDGASMLRIAIAFGSEDIALDLISRGIEIDQKDRSGTTEIQNAFVKGMNRAGLALLERGANIHHFNNYGNNALWYAATHPRPDYEIVSLLVEKGSDILTKNSAGRSVLDAARERNDTKLIEILEAGQP